MAIKTIYVFFLLSLASLDVVNLSKITEKPPVIKKILVIGATGQAGLKIVKEALDRDIQVKAFSRHPDNLPKDVKDKVEPISGDIQNYNDVLKAVKGVDAVIVAVSPRSLDDTSKYLTRGLQNVINAMKAENVEIVNALISDFILMPLEEVPEIYKIETEDQNDMYKALQKSDLKYIATCPVDFSQTPSEAYETAFGRTPGLKSDINLISINQLAKYFIDSLSQPKYYRQKVGIRNKVQNKPGLKTGV